MDANTAWVLATLIVAAGLTISSVVSSMCTVVGPYPVSPTDDGDEYEEEEEEEEDPIDMILHCPECHAQHVDAEDRATNWTNPPHKSHLCHECGAVWRPADVPTYGVAAIRTRGQKDTV